VNALGAACVLLIAVGLWNWQPTTPVGPGAPVGPAAPGSRGARGRVLPSIPLGASGAPTGATPEPGTGDAPSSAQSARDAAAIEAAVPALMKTWRLAITSKNADQVEALDRTFAEHPAAFVPELMSSASSDPEPPVRAFSTRVLGKLHAAESRALMLRLLEDPSEYVRFNAAWAIGELADRDAVAELQRLERHDRSEMVRRSARESLRRLTGG
jgi:hypothetical protein